MRDINAYAVENELTIFNIEGIHVHPDEGSCSRYVVGIWTTVTLAGYRVYYKKIQASNNQQVDRLALLYLLAIDLIAARNTNLDKLIRQACIA